MFCNINKHEDVTLLIICSGGEWQSSVQCVFMAGMTMGGK